MQTWTQTKWFLCAIFNNETFTGVVSLEYLYICICVLATEHVNNEMNIDKTHENQCQVRAEHLRQASNSNNYYYVWQPTVQTTYDIHLHHLYVCVCEYFLRTSVYIVNFIYMRINYSLRWDVFDLHIQHLPQPDHIVLLVHFLLILWPEWLTISKFNKFCCFIPCNMLIVVHNIQHIIVFIGHRQSSVFDRPWIILIHL